MQSVGRVVGRAVKGMFAGGSTPARLRMWMVLTAVFAVGLGVLGATGLGRRDNALHDARDASAQLIDVQRVQVSLVGAAALATENYLRGGPEDAEQRAQYVTELADASSGLVAVSNKVPAQEAELLRAAADGLTKYAGLVEQARANNRQGFPIGAAYLRAANEAASADVAILRSVQASLREQVNDDLDRAEAAGVWLHLAGWPLLLLLLLGGAWMARRFRRMVNVPLAAGAIAAFAVLAAVGGVQASAMSDAEDAVDGPLLSADLAAQALSAAYDARTHELLTLINRGNGAADEAAWGQSSAVAALALTQLCDLSADCAEIEEFRAVVDAHTDLREMDDGGDWDAAKDTSLTGNARIQFNRFTRDIELTSDGHATTAANALADAPGGVQGARVVVFLAGLVVAALVLIGYGRRLREYR
ncbi:MAG: hypothetical protein Q7V57_03910 [Actinomycetota bacterium]|nr:hypothetical protein [Actinomycetota bacterium]